MSLIIEDGAMPDGANSYATIADADSWHRLRRSPPAVWPPAGEKEEEKESALIRAADYLNGLNWKGRRAASGRVMAWPRAEVVDADGFIIASTVVPLAVVYAQCYLAGVIFSGKNIQPVLERGGRIASESVGSLSTTYFDDAASRDVHTALADMLGGLALGLSGVKPKMTVGRASLG